MKLLKNYLYLSLLAVGMTFASCDDEDNYSPGALTDPSCPALTFGSDNVQSIELDPTEPTQGTITLYRGKADAAATYNLHVLRNTDNVYNVPSTVSFAAGATEADITISFNNAEVGKAYTVEIALEDADVDAYSANAYNSFVYTCTRVKWNEVGKGQWLDGFWYWFWDEVTIYQRDDMSNVYRITNPYTDDWINYYGDPTGTYEEYIVFTLSNTDHVSWETFSMNMIYNGEIMAYYPSSYISGSADDENSYAERDEDGNILYFVIDPYWVNDTGYWAYYPCYLAFPGVDLATDWAW